MSSQPKAKTLGGEQVEGRHAVFELLAAGRRRVHEVWIAEGSEEGGLLGQIEELCREERVRIRSVNKQQLREKAISEAPQGVLARADAIESFDIDDLARQQDTKPFLLALDGITDPHNVGSLLRIADCAGATGVVLPSHRSAHVTPVVAKASAGAIEHMPIALVSGLPSALAALKKQGVWTAGLDPGGSASVYDINVADEPIALVLGAEGAGLSKLCKERCDLLVDIPQHGAVASLNVSAAGAVACFEIARRRSVS